MIAKITSGSFIKGLVLYNDEKVKSKEASIISVNNIVSSNRRDVIKTFQTYNKLNNRISKPNFHVSLNFVPGEKISDNKMCDIANDYMKGMGYEEQPFIVYRHFDRDHAHIHIVSTRVKESGKAISTSHNYRKSVALCGDIEINHDLLKAKEQGKSTRDLSFKTLSGIQEFISDKKGNQKQLIENVIRMAYKNPNITSMKSFKSQLQFYNVGMREYDINDKKGYSFFIYKNDYTQNGRVDNSITKPIKASDLHHSPKEDNLKALFAFNKKLKRKLKPEFKTSVKALFNASKSYSEFKNLLHKNNIKYQEYHNAEGLLYGSRFFDSKSGLEYKGSELDLSVATIKNTFQTYPESNLITTVKENLSIEENIFNKIMGDLLQNSGGEDEELSLRKKRKKKRRKI